MKRNFSYAFIANIISALCKFLILLIIIRMGNPTEVGLYNYALVLSAPIFLFASFKIRSIVVTNDDYSVNQLFNSVLFFNILTWIMFMATISIFCSYITIIIVAIVALTKLLENLKEISYGVYQKYENLKLQSVSMSLYYIINLFFFFVLYFLTSNLLISLTVSFVSGFCTLLFYDLPNLKKKYNVYFKIKLDLRTLKEVSILALPLSISTAIGSLNTGFPRIILKSFRDAYILGIFSAIAYLLVIGSLLANSLSQVLLPRLRNYYKSNKIMEFKNLTNKMIYLGSAIGIIAIFISIFAGKQILKISFGNEYAGNNIILIIMSIGLLFILSGVFLGTSIIATGNYNVNYKISLITLVSTILLSFILIPSFGLLGTALTITISQLVTMGGYHYFYKKEIKRWVKNEANYKKDI